jgi:hypothetical protein
MDFAHRWEFKITRKTAFRKLYLRKETDPVSEWTMDEVSKPSDPLRYQFKAIVFARSPCRLFHPVTSCLVVHLSELIWCSDCESYLYAIQALQCIRD